MSDQHYSPTQLQTINNAINEFVDSLVREDSEKELRKAILSRMKEELEFSPKDFRTIAKERYDKSISEKVTQLEDALAMEETLRKSIGIPSHDVT